jgi:hypothetical protein
VIALFSKISLQVAVRVRTNDIHTIISLSCISGFVHYFPKVIMVSANCFYKWGIIRKSPLEQGYCIFMYVELITT